MSSTWAITTFYNPLKGRFRRRNYEIFRRHLDAPLLTVEWSIDGQFELDPADAEILVQVSGGGLMWQKERLLNIGLQRLPSDCRFVAWLDCDIVFHRPDWARLASDLCDAHDVVQLFETAYDLPWSEAAEGSLEDIKAIAPLNARGSICKVIHDSGSIFSASNRDASAANPNFLPNGKVGLAYMASLDFMKRAQLYDANVVGGGDLVFAAAVLGRMEELFTVRRFAPGHRQDILEWAKRVAPSASGEALTHAYVPTGVSHLWHGDKVKRIYSGRYRILEEAGFDPGRHLDVDGNGLWGWNDSAAGLRQTVETYIRSRGDG